MQLDIREIPVIVCRLNPGHHGWNDVRVSPLVGHDWRRRTIKIHYLLFPNRFSCLLATQVSCCILVCFLDDGRVLVWNRPGGLSAKKTTLPNYAGRSGTPHIPVKHDQNLQVIPGGGVHGWKSQNDHLAYHHPLLIITCFLHYWPSSLLSSILVIVSQHLKQHHSLCYYNHVNSYPPLFCGSPLSSTIANGC